MAMGFSADAKNELARLIPARPCCRRAELSALTRLNGILRLGRSRPALVMAVEHAAVARLALTLFRLVFRQEAEVAVRRSRRLHRHNRYLVEVPPAADVQGLLRALGILDAGGGFSADVPQDLLARRCCRKAYLRGAFLARGSVTDPERGYHLELALEAPDFLRALLGVAEGFNFAFHRSERKGEQVLYLKDADEIARFLSLIGASAAVLAFENVRVKRDVRNRVNRLVNADAANLEKTAGAAAAQLEDIELIRTRLGLRSLPRPLREVAEARLAHPEASLRELGGLVSPPVGKSGVSYRMRKLAELAARLRLESCTSEGRNPGKGHKYSE
ncbi:MAG TPA: DNA-binding protein WhiA [Firmicutes bacterium]|nr:DNA-binding protein WhiA [Bacillota bacterium]